MLPDMIKSVVKKLIAVELPHLRRPAVMRARVISSYPQGYWRVYSLKIIDKNGEVDARFPEIPQVYSKVSVELGRNVAIGMPYGELDPVILAEVP